MIRRWGWLLVSVLILLGFRAAPAGATTVAHAYVEQTTNQSTTSATYVDITGMSLASDWSGATASGGTGFVAGHKYLIMVTGQIRDNGAVASCVQVLHGSTAFGDSAGKSDGCYSLASTRISYKWWTIWTAVSSEGIKVQFKIAGGSTLDFDQGTIFAMDLANFTENTGSGGDWIYAERTTDDALTGSATAGASITFTPSVASHDWLVLSHASQQLNSGTVGITSQINQDSGTSLTSQIWTQNNTNWSSGHVVLSRTYSLTAASHTFTEESIESTTNATRLHSQIFAIDLHKFSAHAASGYTDGSINLGAGSFATNIATASITPASSLNTWVGAAWVFDVNNTSRTATFRLRIDSADAPGTQTSDAYVACCEVNLAAGDEKAAMIQAVSTLTAAAHTLDLDAGADATTGTPAALRRHIWAVVMDSGGQAPRSMHQYRLRRD